MDEIGPRKRADRKGTLYVLRRWNSYTPQLPLSSGRGGGYLLKWKGKGIVIDPGFDFLKNMHEIGLSLRDMHCLILTHDHLDHTASLESIIMLAYEAKKRGGADPRLDVIMTKGCKDKFWYWLSDFKTKGVVNDLKDFRLKGGWEEERLDNYGLKLIPLETFHSEGHGDTTTVGLVFNLLDSRKISHIGFTSDTGFFWPKKQSDYLEKNKETLEKCQLVVAHLGAVYLNELLGMCSFKLSQEKEGEMTECVDKIIDILKKRNQFKLFSNLGFEAKASELRKELLSPFKKVEKMFQDRQHLGIFGIYRIFDHLKANKEFKLGIISEFGEELGSYRNKIARVMNEELFVGSTKRILTGDINLRVEVLDDEEKCTQCDNMTALKIKCTRLTCENEVCPICISERCVKYLEKGMFYNCRNAKCQEEQYSPPGGSAREMLTGF